MRIGDAEREWVCQALAEHFTAGRLSGEEFDERVEAAVAARTEGQLRRLLADLPAPTPVVPPPSPRSGPHANTPFDVLFGLLALAAGMCLILLFTLGGARFAGFGFFACLGAATVAAAVTHFVHRVLSGRRA